MKKNLTTEILELIRLLIADYDSLKKFGEYRKVITDINVEINKLNYIKNCLIIFHQKRYREDIKKLTNIIKDMEIKKIKFKKHKVKIKKNVLMIH